jgi:uncharacterized protein YndB with AHSA1/START domain
MGIHIERTVSINAPPERVWIVMADVERWAESTESSRSVERLDSGPLGLGSEARLRVRGGPASVWRVTALTEGQSFTWESDVGGVHGRASHVIDPEGDGSRVTLTVTISGWPATLLSPFLAWGGRRNLRLEAEGLKQRCEASVA